MKRIPFWTLFFISLAANGQLFNRTATLHLSNGIAVMASSKEKKLLLAGDEKGFLYFNDLFTGELISQKKVHENGVAGIRFNSNGKLIISNTYDGEIKIYDLEKDRVIQSVYSPDYSGINFVLFSIADGFIYFNAHERLYKTRSDLTQPVNLILTENDTLTDAVITNDRSALIYSFSNKIKVMNTRTDFPVQDISAGVAPVVRLALVGDTLLTSWSADGTIAYWKYALGQLQTQPLMAFRAGNPSPMSFTADGKLMATGNIGNWARLWEPMNRSVYQELFGHKNTVTSTSFGTTDNILFTGSLDASIIRWEKGAPQKPQETTPLPAIKKDSMPVVQKKDSVPVLTEVKKDTVKTTPEVLMAGNNIPATVRGRNVINTKDLEVRSNKLTVYVYDNSYLDGDTMSLFFNGKWILNGYAVTKKKQQVSIELLPNTNNYLVLFANNLGKSPPNTAAVEIDDGKEKKIFRLSSDLRSCSAINLVYKP